MSKGTSILSSYNRALISDDPARLEQLIDNAIADAYKKAFLIGYNQEEVLIKPEDEAAKLAYQHVCNSSLA